VALASRSTLVDAYLTAKAVASSAVDDYALFLEPVDDLAHALPRTFRGVFGEPFRGIEIRSLE
jgi:hypothetical protein